MNMHEDSVWTRLTWPAAPNQSDYQVYKHYCHGSILLLGSTKLLLPLCDEAWDLNPKYPDIKIKNKDWFTVDKTFDTVIVDGALAFGKDFCNNLLEVFLPRCNTFISRAFLKPNWKTRYINYFPTFSELTPQPFEHPINEIYTFFIWGQRP